ncbi:Prohead protease [uncultured Caudovirales phage]|uniref:Prohead protease n=1 Tax=uncultured Caudovirales phage TaxID=2100421 RepID=A0A6J5P6W3_9CAUD|nr:Prohead protease [uncultured Caudovirales phage]
MTPKQITLICEAKLSADQQANPGQIEATVTTWGAREGADGRRFNYQPEGFMDWAEAFAKEGKPLPMFLNHNSDGMPIGEWNSFEFSDSGMMAEGRMFMNTAAGKDIHTIMKESPTLFGGVSVGAYAEDYQMVNADGEPDQSEEAYFQITKGGLREVSVVMYPNNPEANVSRLEYFRADGTADLKIMERALRDAGLSKNDAVAAASTFKKVLEQRDAVIVPTETATHQSDSDAEATAHAEILAALEQRELMHNLDKRLKR